MKNHSVHWEILIDVHRHWKDIKNNNPLRYTIIIQYGKTICKTLVYVKHYAPDKVKEIAHTFSSQALWCNRSRRIAHVVLVQRMTVSHCRACIPTSCWGRRRAPSWSLRCSHSDTSQKVWAICKGSCMFLLQPSVAVATHHQSHNCFHAL